MRERERARARGRERGRERERERDSQLARLFSSHYEYYYFLPFFLNSFISLSPPKNKPSKTWRHYIQTMLYCVIEGEGSVFLVTKILRFWLLPKGMCGTFLVFQFVLTLVLSRTSPVSISYEPTEGTGCACATV